MTVTQIEAVLKTKIGEVLTISGQKKVRTIDTVAADWDADLLKYFRRIAPAVLVAFVGGPVLNKGENETRISGQWQVLAITAHANSDKARREGDGQWIGAYGIVERLTPTLDGLVIEDVGALQLERVENLWTGKVENEGLAVYGMTFSLPMTFPKVIDDAQLGDFVTFHDMFDIPSFDGEEEYLSWLAGDFSTSKPDAQDTVTLPQET